MSTAVTNGESSLKTITVRFSIYRYQPEQDNTPKMQDYELSIPAGRDMMLLKALLLLKEQDPTLSFRRSCGEGVCGSDGMNINGTNGLACITPLLSLKQPIVLRPLPGFRVERDLIVDMTQFFQQYEKVQPYLQNDSTPPERERLQSPSDREKLDGLYECILCACCSSSCPSFWWNPDKFLGPAALLQACRFVLDSRDTHKKERLAALQDLFSLYRCRSIMNCVQVCPKGLNPTKAISELRLEIVRENA